MTQAHLRPPTPTTEEKRKEAERQARLTRLNTIQKYLSTAGSATRPTLGNMVALLTQCEEWKDVLGFDQENDTVVLKKAPPFATDYEIKGSRPADYPLNTRDLYRIAIWLEREAQMVLTEPVHFDLLLFACRVVASRNT